MSQFQWTSKRGAAAVLLADGLTQGAAAAQVHVTRETVSRWMADVEFSAEVDRLTLMMGIASRAERLRIAKRLVSQRVKDGLIASDKDLLDWLKFAQSETDGIKLDLAALSDLLSPPVADSGSPRPGEAQQPIPINERRRSA